MLTVMVGSILKTVNIFTFEPLGVIELMIDLLSHHASYELHKGINIYFTIELVSQLALFHHETAIMPPFKTKVFRCKLIKSWLVRATNISRWGRYT